MKNIPDKDAIKELKSVISDYKQTARDEYDPEMKNLYECDTADFKCVLDLYKRGKWKKAYIFARSMDTSPREMIPERMYEDISNAYNKI